MTLPIVTELPLMLEPLTADGFAVVVARDGQARAADADQPPSPPPATLAALGLRAATLRRRTI